MGVTRYVAFLRGINVSGHRIIKMEELRQHFRMPGIENIATYIQSGNVVFDTDVPDMVALRAAIEQQLFTVLGYSVTVLLRSHDELRRIVAANPFAGLPADDGRSLSITFLSAPPAAQLVDALPAVSGKRDEVRVVGTDAYILYERYSDSKLSNPFLEKKLGVLATTRNWATVNKVAGM